MVQEWKKSFFINNFCFYSLTVSHMTIIGPHYPLLSSPTPLKPSFFQTSPPLLSSPSTCIYVYMCRCVYMCMYECVYVPSSVMKASHFISMSRGIIYQHIGS